MYKTVTQQVKEFGAKVTREKGYIGCYIYNGVNFTAKLNQDACETTWWEVNLWEDDVDAKVFNYLEGYNRFDRKVDVIASLLQLDKMYDTYEMLD